MVTWTVRPSPAAGSAPHESALLGTVDEAADAGLLELQVPGEFKHPGLTVAQDAQQAQLGERGLDQVRNTN